MIIIIAIVTLISIEAEPTRVALKSNIKKYASTHEEPVSFTIGGPPLDSLPPPPPRLQVLFYKK